MYLLVWWVSGSCLFGGPGAELQRVAAGVIDAFRRVIAGQAEDAVAGPEAVFRIVLARHQRGDEGVLAAGHPIFQVQCRVQPCGSKAIAGQARSG